MPMQGSALVVNQRFVSHTNDKPLDSIHFLTTQVEATSTRRWPVGNADETYNLKGDAGGRETKVQDQGRVSLSQALVSIPMPIRPVYTDGVGF